MNFKKAAFSELELIDQLIFKPCNLNLKNIKPEAESQEYAAHTFQLKEYKVLFRKAKITPTKTGQFVTLWKRNEKGITKPFDLTDEFDFYLIATRTTDKFGVFIFPKNVLHQHRILSDETRDGKRGVRVYPIWDETTNKQAKITQVWQTDYFVDLSNPEQIDINRVQNLLKIE